MPAIFDTTVSAMEVRPCVLSRSLEVVVLATAFSLTSSVLFCVVGWIDRTTVRVTPHAERHGDVTDVTV
jgi:hypothetical protein